MSWMGKVPTCYRPFFTETTKSSFASAHEPRLGLTLLGSPSNTQQSFTTNLSEGAHIHWLLVIQKRPHCIFNEDYIYEEGHTQPWWLSLIEGGYHFIAERKDTMLCMKISWGCTTGNKWLCEIYSTVVYYSSLLCKMLHEYSSFRDNLQSLNLMFGVLWEEWPMNNQFQTIIQSHLEGGRLFLVYFSTATNILYLWSYTTF